MNKRIGTKIRDRAQVFINYDGEANGSCEPKGPDYIPVKRKNRISRYAEALQAYCDNVVKEMPNEG